VSDTCHWLAAVHWGQAGTWALAIGTFSLACFTYKMAKSTEKALDQNVRLVEETHELAESNKTLVIAEQTHHEENLRPYCFLELGAAEIGKVNLGVFGKPEVACPEGYAGLVIPINAKLRNIGLGPAISIVLRLVIMSDQDETGCAHMVIEMPIPPMAAQSEWYGTSTDFLEPCSMMPAAKVREALSISVFLRTKMTPEDFQKVIANSGWLIFVMYEDIFHHKSYSQHEKHPNLFFTKVTEGKPPDLHELNFAKRAPIFL
jgi:hypothetical protein